VKKDHDNVGTGALAPPVEPSSAAHAAESDRIEIRGQACPRHIGWVRNFATIFVSTLHEIFDESAYARFLQRTQTPSSAIAYAAFQQEHGALKARRPRCC
jgi:hypothetical protein